MTECSETTPTPIYNLDYAYDTISISEEAYLLDINVIVDIMHSYDGDLLISLIGPDGTEIILSEYNGGSGNHYSNTKFDDQAEIPISDGQPPFNGSYIPEQALSAFNHISLHGDWILTVYDNNAQDPGNLSDWCVEMQYTMILLVLMK